ncbi:hypothetical protein [Psychrobacter phenylpyruvicus]|uniref:Uncharacterized protein n=1 Tax=Psychrobacter phenylpyruvicus TaxID=29432 RepID=A0A379LP06_9GAMM|nr:hypothetical protein [Psychrobacter phenylpyruvicus]SUD92330.1 Uncharacterised protein [Psychrobacter phenylpyruvicus]
MTYLAPRQGLFAIIILISFFIQTTLLLISTNQQLDELKMQTGERMLVQLIDEVKLPLLSKDKVSLSVLTGRYTSENTVASLTVKDIDNQVLVQTGQAQLLEGKSISRQVIMGDTVIGTVNMTLRDTGNGEIIASQWVFILGSFITHLLIWLLYGYVARPTREQLAALSRDVQDYLLTQNQGQGMGRVAMQRQDYESSAEETRPSDGLSIGKALGNYIKTQQKAADEGDYEVEDAAQPVLGTTDDSQRDILTKIDDNAAGNTETASADGAKSATKATTTEAKPQPLVANRPIEVATVKIRFYDPNSLLSALAFEKSEPYFALCTQLLQRTIDEVLKQPILFGIKLNNKPVFDENGATVEFLATTSHSKAGLAAIMLAKAYVMLNEVTYIKHRELQRFALQVVAGISDQATSEKMEQLLVNNAKAGDILALLPVEGIKQLRGYTQLNSLKNPTTVYERDCASLEGVSDSMMQRLIEVRDAVLLSALN